MRTSVGEETIVLMQGLKMLERFIGNEVNIIHGMKIGV
jgi:hypothetical protein